MANQKLPKAGSKKKFNQSRLIWIIIILGIYYLLNSISVTVSGIPREITYSDFYNTLKNQPTKIKYLVKIENELQGEFTDNTKFKVNIPENDQDLLKLIRENVAHFEIKPPRTFLAALLFNLSPILLLILFWWVMAARGEQLGNRIMAFGKVRPKVHIEGESERVTFNDVAGVDEAKEELQEVIEFLKDPKKFQRLGGKIPKGVLLIGPPGCGKTLVARAVAGEAGVPFFSISGSDFVEMFVGVGASVTGDTPVLIKRDGEVKLLPISKFVDEFYPHDKYGFVIPLDGIQTLGYEAKRTNSDKSENKFFGRSEWQDIKGVFRHKVNEIYEIHYLGGVIKTTSDHSIFVRDRNRIIAKRACDLKLGDILVNLPFKVRGQFSKSCGTLHFVRAHLFNSCFPLELKIWEDDEELRKNYEFAINNRDVLSQAEIAQLVGVSQSAVGLWQREVHLPRGLSIKANPSWENLPQKIMVTKQLMRLLGYYTAEGRKTDYFVQFIFGAKENKLHNDCIGLMQETFNLKPHLGSTADNALRITYHSKLLGDFFEKYCGNGSHGKHIPSFLWDLPKEYFLSYLEGLAKGDGYISKEGKLIICSVSKQLILELCWLCSLHGIGVGLRKCKNPAGRVIKNKPLPEGSYYLLIISKTSNPFQRVKLSFQFKKPRVKKVIKKPYEGFVYDLCGLRNEAFFGGEKPLLLHNSRVRDLFEQGRRAAKTSGKGAIIFIDEIDAVGRLRFAGIGGGHDEREQTLNQLLVEMDGFDTQKGLILIAATNRPDTLDPALLRPGRFDRTIIINLPDIKGREEILKVHTRKIKLSPNIDLKSIARSTPGFSGADIANLCNEAALLAARNNKEAVENSDFEKSVERVVMGPEKKSHIMSKKEKEITALHESGHALLSLLIPEVNPVKKVSIIPRGLAGGYTFTPPLEDRHYWSKKELISEIALMLGGRVSEEINLNEVTTGAQNDLEMATHMARRMVTQFGMSDKLGNITLGRREGLVFLGRDIFEEKNYSEETARLIDEEVKKIVDESYNKAKTLLEQNRDKLKTLTNTLLEKEVLDGEEVKKLLGIDKKDENS